MSPSALLEIEEKANDLIPLEAIRRVVEGIFALDVSGWGDEHFATLEGIIDRLVNILSTPPIAPEHRPLIEKLFQARVGVEQGMAPDSSKRQTEEQMRAFVSAHL